MAELRQHEAPTLDPRLVGKGARCPTCHCWLTLAENGEMWRWSTRNHWTDSVREGPPQNLPGQEAACKGYLVCNCACANCECHRTEESARNLLLSLVT